MSYEQLHDLITRKRDALALPIEERSKVLEEIQSQIDALSEQDKQRLDDIEEDYYWEDQSCQ